MKEVTIHMLWRNEVTVEVEDDFDPDGYLDDFPDDVLEAMQSNNAELIDWGSTPTALRQV